MKLLPLCLALLLACQPTSSDSAAASTGGRVQLGAEILLRDKTADLKGKRIALVAHAASYLPNGVHLADTLLRLGVKVQKVLAPEHGFRGQAEAGASVESGKDVQTGLPVVSLHGKNKKPTAADLTDIDLVIFDLQDVGVRYYTYTSTLRYVMEACAEHGKPLWVLDRPNPHAGWVGGPTMDEEWTSFLGMEPGLPIVYGMTIGEYAMMLNDEIGAKLEVVKLENYKRTMRWSETGLPWRPPSPNLPTARSAELYPALCWLEGTDVSLGRGTEAPFTRFGAPWHQAFRKLVLSDSIAGKVETLKVHGTHWAGLRFTPRSKPGFAATPLHQDQMCWGLENVDSVPPLSDTLFLAAVQLLKNCWREHQAIRPGTEFWNLNFNYLAGTDSLQKQVEAVERDQVIVDGWKPGLERFEAVRKKYLLYP